MCFTYPLLFDERIDLGKESTSYNAFLEEERKDAVSKEQCAHRAADDDTRDRAARKSFGLQDRNRQLDLDGVVIRGVGGSIDRDSLIFSRFGKSNRTVLPRPTVGGAQYPRACLPRPP